MRYLPIRMQPKLRRLHKTVLAILTYKVTLLIFCLVVAALFVLTPRLYSLLYGYIDPSFNYALNNAAAAKQSFGTQFIATYGPLGYLVTDYLPASLAKAATGLVIYSLALGSGVYLFSSLYVKKLGRRYLSALGLLYVLTITNLGGSIEWGYLTTFLLYCFIYIRLTKRWQYVLAVGLAVVAALFSLTKFTLGFSSLVALGLVILLSIDATLWDKIRQGAVALAVCLITFLGLGHHLGITNFIQYIKTALLESQNFNVAMSSYDKQTAFATWMAAAALIGVILWPLTRGRREFVRYLFLAPGLFTIWKYVVVRQDGHMLRLLQMTIPLAILLFIVWQVRTRLDRRILLGILLASTLAIWANKLPFSGPNSYASAVTSPLTNLRSGAAFSFWHFGREKARWAKESAAGLGGARLPVAMRQAIGSSGVDVFPWETSIIAANNLTWDNRPSPFSFETYDPSLDNANAAFFTSSKAAPFIVWHNTGGVLSVDGRHILWDEPATMRAIFMNYSLKASDKNFMLLEKRPKPITLQETTVTVSKPFYASSNWSTLPNAPIDQLQFLQFKPKTTIFSTAEASLIRGHQYFLDLKTASGREVSYRFVPENSSQGFLVNDLPATWPQLVQLVADKQLSSYDPIVAYRMITH